MTYSEIECFLAICHYKTGSRAAEALYITQPSLSTRLKTLEKELGGELFYRKKGSREMLLTEAGKDFYRLAVQYESLVQEMLQVCRKQPEKLRISSLDSLDTFLLPRVYERFIQNYPQIGLEIQDMDLEPASLSIHAGATDIAFTTGVNTDRALHQTRLFMEPMVVICGENTPLQEPVTRDQLAAVPEVFIEWSSEFTRWHQQALGLRPKLSISIMNHLQQFMEKGNCWSIVPVSVALGLKERLPVRQLEASFVIPGREVSIVTTLNSEQNTAISAFRQCLKETVAEYPQIKPLI